MPYVYVDSADGHVIYVSLHNDGDGVTADFDMSEVSSGLMAGKTYELKGGAIVER